MPLTTGNVPTQFHWHNQNTLGEKCKNVISDPKWIPSSGCDARGITISVGAANTAGEVNAAGGSFKINKHVKVPPFHVGPNDINLLAEV